jgi:hypothetical protein
MYGEAHGGEAFHPAATLFTVRLNRLGGKD